MRQRDKGCRFGKHWVEGFFPGCPIPLPPRAYVEDANLKSQQGRLVFVIWPVRKWGIGHTGERVYEQDGQLITLPSTFSIWPIRTVWKGMGQWGGEWYTKQERRYYIPSKSAVYQVEGATFETVAIMLWEYVVLGQ